MMMTMRYVWTCHCRGQEFDELPLSFGAEAPLPWLSVKEAEQRDHVDPLFGWSCNSLPGYPDTFALKTRVHLRNDGMRPFVEVEPTDHPLAVEQREGITMQRVADIAATCMRH